MMKENNELDNLNEIKSAIEHLLSILDYYGWELNDDGDIVEKGTNILVMEKYYYNGEFYD